LEAPQDGLPPCRGAELSPPVWRTSPGTVASGQTLPSTYQRKAPQTTSGGAHNRHDRKCFATRIGVQSQLKSSCWPHAKKFFRSVRVAVDTRDVACQAPAWPCGKKSARQRTGPDKIEPWIGLTGELTPYLGIPPSTSRLIPTPGTLKVPLTPVGDIGSE